MLSSLCEPKLWPGNPSYPFDSNGSSDTVNRAYHRKPSSNFKGSLGSGSSRQLRVANENALPSRTASLSTLDFLEGISNSRLPNNASENPICGTYDCLPGLVGKTSASISDVGPLEDIDLNSRYGEVSQRSSNGSESGYSPNHGLSFELQAKETLSTKIHGAASCRPSIVVTDAAAHPIRRFLSTLRHGHLKSKRALSVRKERWSLDDFDEDQPVTSPQQRQVRPSGHKKTSSWASSGFVTAVKSATTSIGTLSAPQSQLSRRLAPLRNSKRSSKLSQVTNRESVNGNNDTNPMVDEAAWDRALQRRRTLEELVSSEESYIADLKVLKNVSIIFRVQPSNNLIKCLGLFYPAGFRTQCFCAHIRSDISQRRGHSKPTRRIASTYQNRDSRSRAEI